MKEENNRPYIGINTSKWGMFLNEAISYLQWDFDRRRGGYIDKKGVIAEICKKIFSESDTLAQTSDVSIISIRKPTQKWIDPNA